MNSMLLGSLTGPDLQVKLCSGHYLPVAREIRTDDLMPTVCQKMPILAVRH
jgi:hypothetical protein